MTRHGPHYRVPFRRRGEGRTDYRRRLNLLRAGEPRAVVRRTNTGIIVQLVNPADPGDRILASAVGRDLRKLGWSGSTGNVPAAYLTGLLAGRRAASRGVTRAILDLGRQAPAKGGRVFAALKGLLDAGLKVPHDPQVLPAEERIRGDHATDGIRKSFADTKAKVEAA